MTGLDQVLVKKKSKLELEKEAAAAAPREAAVKKQTPRVGAIADSQSSTASFGPQSRRFTASFLDSHASACTLSRSVLAWTEGIQS